MSFLRRTVAVLAITLLISPGAGGLWSIEIDSIEGRPWDSGSVDVNRDPKQRPVYEKDLNYRAAPPEIEKWNRERKEKSLDEFLSNLLSFLNP